VKRWIGLPLGIVLFAGCSSAGGLLPTRNVILSAVEGRRNVHVHVRMTIPRRHRGEHVPLHPSTISPLTQSVGISVNGGAGHVFNASPLSPGCSESNGATTCTFMVAAPPGSDTFVVSTFSAAAGGGTMLDHGVAVLAIAKGAANSVAITLGPVVTTTADGGIGSLRYAIGAANPGDTITFLLAAGSTITLGSTLTLSKNVSLAGPGVTTSARRRRDVKRPRAFSGITIDGNHTQQIFIVNAGVTASISGLILAHGEASNANVPGGAVYNAGSLALAADALAQNDSIVYTSYARHDPREIAGRIRAHTCTTSYYYGGAVYNHALLTVTNSTFDSNQLQNNFYLGCQYSAGGGIYNDQSGTLTVTGSTFSNNAAYRGGAVYNNSAYGSASFASDTFENNAGCTEQTGCAISGCSGNGCTSNPYGEGAAIFDNGGQGISVTNSTFSNNVAGGVSLSSGGTGGALFLGVGAPTIASSTFSGNIAGGGTTNCSVGNGGAIATNTAVTLEIDNDTFVNNQATGDLRGKAGAVDGLGAIVGTNDTFSANAATASGSTCTVAGSFQAFAGALYAGNGLRLSATSFSNNAASAPFSAIGGALDVAGPASTLSGDTFTSNTATASGAFAAGNAIAEGGAIIASALRISNSTFTSNAVTAESSSATMANGGALDAQGALISIGNTFASNSATATAGPASYVEGGGVYSGNTPVTSVGDTFKSNGVTGPYAVYGGGAFISGQFSITGATFIANAVTETSGPSGFAAGGGIYIDGGPGTFSNSSVSGNSAGTGNQAGFGGGVFDNVGVTMAGLTISNNSTTAQGGGLFDNGIAILSGSTISGNHVTQAPGAYSGGGGVYDANAMSISSSTISGNTVVLTNSAIGSGGGGIYNYGTLELTASTVSGNSVSGRATGNGGGGIASANDSAFTNDTITGNTSSVDGGGFATISNHTFTLNNVTLYQNTAVGNGGNVQNVNTITLTNSIVAGGSATHYNDIHNYGTVTSGDYNIIQDAVIGNPPAGTLTHVQNVDPKLLPLANNGGPTLTNADQATSPGTAAIPYGGVNCGGVVLTTDQRNFTRGAGGKCDIGAYEYAGVASAIRMHVRPAKPSHRRPITVRSKLTRP
jgi:hypothetical protein